MSQVKIIFVLLILSAFLGLGWAYQDAKGDADKYQKENKELTQSVKDLKEVANKVKEADKISDNTTSVVIAEKKEVTKTTAKILDKVNVQVLKIDKEYQNINKDVTDIANQEIIRDDKISAVYIDALWEAYCGSDECQPQQGVTP